MNIEQLRDFCLSLPHSAEAMPFDDTVVVFKVGNLTQSKIFALVSLEDGHYTMLKCDPEQAIELREKYSFIEGAYHMNKRHWNGIRDVETIDNQLLEELILHSYELVRRSLKKTVRDSLL